METGVHFYSLLIIAGLAFILPILVNRIKFLRIPVVVSEIIAGIIVGRSGLNIVSNDIWIEFLSLLGISFLMFISGLEIDLAFLKRSSKISKGKANPLFIGLLMFLMTTLLAILISSLLYNWGFSVNPIFLTLIFMATSLGIIVPTLKEKGIINEPLGQIVLVSASIADFATMIVLPAIIFFINIKYGLQLFFTVFLFLFFVFLYAIGKKYLNIDFNSSHTYEAMQLKVRAAFFLILIFVSLSYTMNIEIILGAFLAGILFSLLFKDFKKELSAKLDVIGYGFLIPIFFIMVGVNFNLQTILHFETLILLPVLILTLFFVKVVPALVLKRYFKWSESIGSGFLLSSGLSLIIAISIVALEAGIIDEATHGIFVLYAIVTSLIAPVIFLKIVPTPVKAKQYVILAGNSEYVISIARKVSKSPYELIIVDTSKEIRDKIKQMDIKHLYYDILDKNLLSKLMRHKDILSFTALYKDTSKNIMFSKIASELGYGNAVAFIDDHLSISEAEDVGVNVVAPIIAMDTLLSGYVLHPESAKHLFNKSDYDKISFKEISIRFSSTVGLQLKDIKLPGDCLVLLISRKNKQILPNEDTIIKNEDNIVIMGSEEYIHEAIKVLSDYLNKGI